MTHLFEVSKETFDLVMNGDKKFLVTKRDRPYKKGDKIVIQELDGSNLTSDELSYEISLVENDEGLKANFCIIAIIPHKIIN
jgi:hypothetical protein